MTIRSKFYSHIAKTSPFSLGFEVTQSSGAYLYDEKGKKYFDFISGIGVSSLGHSNPKIIEAIHKQSREYLHTMVYGEHIQSPQVQLADKLISLLPLSFDQVYFLNSGAEAIDCAMKTARKYTGRKKIIACKNAYHGSTYGAMSLMSAVDKTAPYGPGIPEVFHIDFNDGDQLMQIDQNTACIMMEVIQAEAGIQLPDGGYLKAMADRCREVGALLIFDEIQSGMGRAGSLFAFQKYMIAPDILVLGKSLGGGMPLSAILGSNKIMNAIADNPPLTHMSTFGGHPVCSAAGLASLDILIQGQLIQKSKVKSELFVSLIRHHSAIQEIRNTGGLWMAIDLGQAEIVTQLIPIAQSHGLLIDWFLFNDQSIRIAPPLTITDKQIHEAAEILMHSLDKALNS